MHSDSSVLQTTPVIQSAENCLKFFLKLFAETIFVSVRNFMKT